MEKRRAAPAGSAIVVSMIGRDRVFSANQVAGFTAGAQAAVPAVVLVVEYSGNLSEPSVC